jgi:hypothetical protein
MVKVHQPTGNSGNDIVGQCIYCLSDIRKGQGFIAEYGTNHTVLTVIHTECLIDRHPDVIDVVRGETR